MERDFKGVWIPKEIWLDEKLSTLEKVIFCGILHFSHDKNMCYESNSSLSEFCQCSETKISKAISKLIGLGYVYTERFNGRQRAIVIDTEWVVGVQK